MFVQLRMCLLRCVHKLHRPPWIDTPPSSPPEQVGALQRTWKNPVFALLSLILGLANPEQLITLNQGGYLKSKKEALLHYFL